MGSLGMDDLVIEYFSKTVTQNDANELKSCFYVIFISNAFPVLFDGFDGDS